MPADVQFPSRQPALPGDALHELERKGLLKGLNLIDYKDLPSLPANRAGDIPGSGYVPGAPLLRTGAR